MQAPVPKVRILERVLSKDAAPDDKVAHAETQLKELEDWGRKAQTWMEKAEVLINGFGETFEREEAGKQQMAQSIETDKEAMTKRLEATEKKVLESPPGLPNLAEIAAKVETFQNDVK